MSSFDPTTPHNVLASWGRFAGLPVRAVSRAVSVDESPARSRFSRMSSALPRFLREAGFTCASLNASRGCLPVSSSVAGSSEVPQLFGLVRDRPSLSGSCFDPESRAVMMTALFLSSQRAVLVLLKTSRCSLTARNLTYSRVPVGAIIS